MALATRKLRFAIALPGDSVSPDQSWLVICVNPNNVSLAGDIGNLQSKIPYFTALIKDFLICLNCKCGNLVVLCIYL